MLELRMISVSKFNKELNIRQVKLPTIIKKLEYYVLDI